MRILFASDLSLVRPSKLYGGNKATPFGAGRCSIANRRILRFTVPRDDMSLMHPIHRIAPCTHQLDRVLRLVWTLSEKVVLVIPYKRKGPMRVPKLPMKSIPSTNFQSEENPPASTNDTGDPELLSDLSTRCDLVVTLPDPTLQRVRESGPRIEPMGTVYNATCRNPPSPAPFVLYTVPTLNPNHVDVVRRGSSPAT